MFDMVVAGRIAGDDVAVMMVEAEATANTVELVAGGAKAPTEQVVAEGLEAAKGFIRILCDAQSELAAKAAKETVEFPVFPDYQPDAYEAVEAAGTDELSAALVIADKQEREAAIDRVKGQVAERLAEQFEGRDKEIGAAFRSLTKKLVRQRCCATRSASTAAASRHPSAVGRGRVVPRAHGSALFERGETQIMGVTTLNMLKMEQQLDTLSPETRKRYMHNYNFPPYSTGETGRVGSPKRREIGHGALAERALLPVLPSKEEFPYAIRQVSEALGSNGSTSMGSVCASTLSLLNAGVPLKFPVAGIAMGLVSDEVDGETRVRGAHRHPRCGGRVRRHGLQGRRHQGLRDRPAAGHQARRHLRLGACRRADPGPRRAPGDPRGHGRGHRRAGRVASSPRGSSRSTSRSTRSAR